MSFSTDPIEIKRQVHIPPFLAGEFNAGVSIYLPSSDMEELRSGMVVERNGEWYVTLAPKENGQDWDTEPLVTFSHNIGHHLLIDHSGIDEVRGVRIDVTPWFLVKGAIIAILESAPSYRLRFDDLTAELKKNSAIDFDLVSDVLKMFATMGGGDINVDKGGIWYGLSKLLIENAERRRYLESFSEELLVKSRRIDHLIRHTGTVGSYREGLLRNMLRQILPQRYEVSTGFVENCPRQLDIIIWESHRYGALFRDGDIVVVPAASVRAVIEVKTTLSTGPLDEALDILDEVMRVTPPLIPVFKGIFAFESEYIQSQSVAERVRTFYLGKRSDGINSREHYYMFQGVQMICVPHAHLVRHRYQKCNVSGSYPRPSMEWYDTSGSGDVNTAAFIAEILMYLDIDPAAKSTQLELFHPLLKYLRSGAHLQLFDDHWRPRLHRTDLMWTQTADGADRYICKFIQFRSGQISADELAADTDLSGLQ